MSDNFIETFETGAVSFSGTGDNTIIAAPGAGKYLAIDFLQFVPSADVTLTMWNGPSTVSPTNTNFAISGDMPFKANQPNTIENAVRNEHGILTCDDNQPFVIKSSGASTVTGFMRYRIINK